MMSSFLDHESSSPRYVIYFITSSYRGGPGIAIVGVADISNLHQYYEGISDQHLYLIGPDLDEEIIF